MPIDANKLNADITLVFTALSILYGLGKDIAPALQNLYQLLILKEPLTDEQRKTMLDNHNALSSGLQRPIDDSSNLTTAKA